MSILVNFAKQIVDSSTTLDDDDYDILFDLTQEEFPDYLIEVSLDYKQLSQLDNKLPHKNVYFEDDRLPELIKITQQYPTYRDIIKQLETVYDEDMIESHRYLELFRIRYSNTQNCILDAFWGS